jgi:hypothetical protein
MTESPIIIQMNVDYYRALLKRDMGDEKRSVVERLLAEAESALLRAANFERAAAV